MIRIIAAIMVVVIMVGIIGTIGFMVVKTAGYMFNQKFNFHDALDWAWKDYNDMIHRIIPAAKADQNYEIEYNINRYIDVVACTALQF